MSRMSPCNVLCIHRTLPHLQDDRLPNGAHALPCLGSSPKLLAAQTSARLPKAPQGSPGLPRGPQGSQKKPTDLEASQVLHLLSTVIVFAECGYLASDLRRFVPHLPNESVEAPSLVHLNPPQKKLPAAWINDTSPFWGTPIWKERYARVRRALLFASLHPCSGATSPQARQPPCNPRKPHPRPGFLFRAKPKRRSPAAN